MKNSTTELRERASNLTQEIYSQLERFEALIEKHKYLTERKLQLA